MRETSRAFAAEGQKIFEEAPEGDILGVYVSESFFSEHADLLREKGVRHAENDQILRQDYATGQILRAAYEPKFAVVSDSRFEAVSDTKSPQGILTVLRPPVWEEERYLAKEAPLILAAEHLQDPGNAGTILRTAEAAGADAVYFTEDSADILNPKVVRATMGSLFRMPVFYVPSAPDLIAKLHTHGIRTYAAYLPGSTLYDEPDYKSGTAFFIGNESRGLTAETAEAASQRIRIPMTEHINSLNAAMAAGILMYEAARQRRSI